LTVRIATVIESVQSTIREEGSMSLADLSVSPSDSGGGSEFGRTPPQDVAAEQSVLGAMMLSKDAIADVVEELKGTDFYRPAHELIYDSILDLYGRGEPADGITVAAELTKRGELSKVGGPAYIHTLISSVPTAANAGYYARIVRERGVLRRLVDAGTRIVQLGYNGADGRGGGDVEEIVNSAQAEIYKVSEARTSEDYHALSEVIEGAIDEIEASSHRGDGLTGVPTGFADLDALTNGLHPGQMIIIAARPAMGKALALDTPLPTPQGWSTMGAVQVGDELIGADGKPTRVVNATDEMVGRPCYEVEFSDGSVIVADAEHQWLTETRGSHSAGVRTTEQIAATLRRDTADRSLNHSVINAEALNLPEQDLLVPPYTLGAWLGDDIRAEPGVVMRLEDDGLDFGDFSALTGALRTIGVLGEKHIPASYLRASQAQRRDLLAGLLDTNGTVHSNGAVQFSATSERLALGARELVISLGYRCTVVNLGDALLLTFTTGDRVFNLERKHLLHKDRMSRRFHRHDSRFITAVRPIPSVPVRCVEVDNRSHLYLAGRTMIPTHNSTFGLDILRSAAIHHRMTSVMFSLEMGRNEITMRLLSAEARIPLQNMRKGTMREEDWTRLAKTMGDVSDAPLFIDDSPNMSLMEIRAKCRRLKQRHDLKLVVIDYLQLMTSGKRVESRQQEVSEFSRAIKLLAKELQLPVIALSQLNRGPEQRTDKKPAMSDLRESGSIEQDADMVILLHREDAYEKESPRAGEADFIVAKHRNGPTDTITVAFQGHYSRFVDMAQ
jgi:replicative DNA helicase